MRYTNFLLVFLILFAACKENLTQQHSVQISVQVRTADTSFVTRGIMDTVIVAGAKVELKSVSYGIIYKSVSDSRGIAAFSDIIPDLYHITVNKLYPADIVKQHLAIQKDVNLVGSLSAVPLSTSDEIVEILLKPVFASNLVISEIYYNGAMPPPAYYFHDQFTEIYNNSSETVYLDSFAVCDPSYSSREDAEFLHCVHLYKFPGSGMDYPLAPGEHVIIAQDAINHQVYNANSVDLRAADFEYYNRLSGDVDVKEVPNMIQLHHKYGNDFLYSVMNASIVLVKLEAADSVWQYDQFNEILVPNGRAVDGVEYRESTSEFEYKHLPDEIDAGITGGSPAYKGKSVARKILNIVEGQIILMDNNNSSTDFEVLDKPTPGVIGTDE